MQVKKKLKFGTIELDMPFIQAPLAGYTDHPMRIIARRFGCPLVFTGVMLDKVSLHPKASKQKKFLPFDGEHPVGAQILGDDPHTMAASAGVFEKAGYDCIDLNFACPVPKVLRRNRGGWLLRRPQVIRETYLRTRESVKCPVFMKIRIGFDGSEASREDFWQICENAAADGVAMLAIHGRTVEQKYRGRADWDVLAEVKKRFPNLIVFGSGDIMTAQTAVERLRTSGLDGIIVARGAVGNPWIFQEIRAIWEEREIPPEPQLDEQREVMSEHLRLICDFWPPKKAVAYFRKFTVGYCRRHPERKKVLLDFMAAKTLPQIAAVFKKWY